MTDTIPVRWIWATESALLARLETDDLASGATAARALRARIAALGSDGGTGRELVVGAASLLVRFASPPGEREIAPILALERIEPTAAGGPAPREHRFAVTYGGEDGPDLAEVVRQTGRSEREVVALHAGAVYTVGFVGFSPGFAYLLGLPPALERPRRASPRPRVPAGSVAIAGPFSGVYPQATPGGWHLLGRLDPLSDREAPLFDPSRDPPARLAPGDRVRFVPR